jgi:hypothetical protein
MSTWRSKGAGILRSRRTRERTSSASSRDLILVLDQGQQIFLLEPGGLDRLEQVVVDRLVGLAQVLLPEPHQHGPVPAFRGRDLRPAQRALQDRLPFCQFCRKTIVDHVAVHAEEVGDLGRPSSLLKRVSEPASR